MKVSISIGEKVYEVGARIPAKQVINSKEIHPDKNKFLLAPGRDDYNKLTGERVFITGDEYLLGFREYPLGNNYGIEAILTVSGTLVPKLRRAIGKEKNIRKDDDGNSNNKFWPVIDKIKEIKENEH